MKDVAFNRRDFLKIGMAAGTAVSLAAAFPKFSMANVKTVTLKDVIGMTEQEMAENANMVTASYTYLKNVVASMDDMEMRGIVEGVMRNPAPTLMADLMDEKNRRAVYDELKTKNLIENDLAFEKFLPDTKNPFKSPSVFIAGPGSGYTSHHAYPGGLITHTALNTMVSLAIYEGYKDVYGFGLDRNVVIASQVLHDLHKPWVFQWDASGESRTELKLAGTGEHHVLSIAESMLRGMPSECVVAQACAHNHPGWENDEKGPVNWIMAASIITGIDPIKENLLEKDSKTLPLPRRMENFVCHLGDHDWILTVPAAQWIIPVMEEIAVEKYGVKPEELKTEKFYKLRNYAFAQASIMGLYEVYSTRGKEALAHTVMSIVTPA